MANVQKRLQSMTLEFEELSRTGLFSKEEVKIIIKKMTEFENKIDAYTRSLQNYNDYIDYNICIYRLVRLKRDRMKMGDKFKNIEQRITKRTKALFNTLLKLYPANKALYFNFYKFCRETRSVNVAASVCENMVKYHNSEEGWLTAAKWFVYDANNLSQAVKFCKRGLAIFKSSPVLYNECVFMEVKLAAEEMSKDSNPQQKIDTINAVVKTYLEKMTVYINDCQFYIAMIEWMKNFTFMAPTVDEIIKYLIDKHSDDELVWDFLAHWEKRGFHYSGLDDGADIKVNAQTRLLLCIKRYKDGLERVPRHKKKALWSLYIKCLVEATNEDYKNSQIDKREILISAFNKASDDGCLCEEGYISWLDLVTDNQARNILQLATTKCPTSVDLWKLRLRYEIFADRRNNILSTFEEGVEALKENSSGLWLLVLRYHILNSTEAEIDEFYKKAIKQHSNISHLLIPKYLERLFLKNDINTCRSIYHSLAIVKPYCKDIHITMSQLESSCVIYDIAAWEKVHKLAVAQFGEDIDIWLNYIDFHLYYKKSSIDEIMLLFQKGKDALPSELFLVFKDKCRAKFNKFKSIFDNNNAL